MNWEEQMMLWNQASAHVSEICHKVLWEGQNWMAYRLPANMFLQVISGSAHVRINEEKYYLQQHQLLHAGAGMEMDITTGKHGISFYLICYEAIIPDQIHMKSVGSQPSLACIYHVIFPDPGRVHHHLQRMYELWMQSSLLTQIQMKSLLYTFIFELFCQLLKSKDRGSPSELLTYAVSFIQEHYQEAVSMDHLADFLGCSTSYMYRLFKAEVGSSPNEYLIKVRMEHAHQYLTETSFGLQEIASLVGYGDVYYFSRLFKKHFGCSPLQARKRELLLLTLASPKAPVDTRMYRHKYGVSQIPFCPKRIVTAYHLGHMLALDVKPLGASTYILQYSEHAMHTSGIIDLGAPLCLDKIAALEPDLIILVEAYLKPSGGYGAFNRIAPTVVLDVYQDPVKDIRIIGDVLNEHEKAEKWIGNYQNKIAQTKGQIQQKFGTVDTFTILNIRSEKKRFIYRDRNMGGNILYTYWGLAPQEKVRQHAMDGITDESSYLEISEDMIPDYVGDHLVVALSEGEEHLMGTLQANAWWNDLKAVQKNQVYTINFDQFLFNDPISTMKQVDLLEELLC